MFSASSAITCIACSPVPQCSYSIAAVDVRGHGATVTSDNADLSAPTLMEAGVAVHACWLPRGYQGTMQDAVAEWTALAGASPPPMVLLGHSMGGAVAVHAAASGRMSSLAGVVMWDVVEGTALQVSRSDINNACRSSAAASG